MWNSNRTSAGKYTISLYKTAWDCRVYMDEPREHENVQDHILASQNKNGVTQLIMN